MKYLTYEDWMVGKIVKEISTGDLGVVECRNHDESVYVQWTTGSDRGSRLHICLESVEFVESMQVARSPEEIVIDGKRYKLVLIE